MADTTVLGGEAGGALAGLAVATGDHDGDGCDDIATGAAGETGDDGTVYLLFGGTL